MRIVAGNLLFESPSEVVRTSRPAELRTAFAQCEAALERGAWIAGYVPYEGADAALGVFGAPRAIELPDPVSVLHSPLLATVDRATYDTTVARLHRAIYDGDVYQVNYTIPFALATQSDPFALWAYYARRCGARYQAYVEDGNRRALSWSPELFLEFDGRRVRTKPMKGTAPLEAIAELHDAKNRAEHVMIVDLLRNDLHRVCDRVEVERFTDIERYPTYATMTSTIAGTLRDGVTIGDVFIAAFPCGSVTGAPKRAAMRFIAEVEAQPRGCYCGAIGFLSPQRRGWWNVAIRTATLDAVSGAGRFDVGGGIVADSRPSAEWAEMLVKSRFLRETPFDILETFAGDADDVTIARHVERMLRSAQAFGIAVTEHEIAAALRQDQGDKGLVRVRLGFDGSLHVFAETAGPLEEPVSIGLSSARVRCDDPFLHHKTSWRPAHDAAMRETQTRGWFDALLQNGRGEITEGWRSNVFVDRGGTLLTPPLSAGVLPGILRRRLLDERRAREATIVAGDLRDGFFVGNSARGLLRAVLADI